MATAPRSTSTNTPESDTGFERGMRLTIKSAALAASLTLVGTALVAGPAMADPKGDTFELTCGSSVYEAIVSGNGEWTPAHVAGSTKVFIPVGFGAEYGTVVDSQGDVIDSFPPAGDPPVFKSGTRTGQGAPLKCSYTGSSGPVDDDFYGPNVTFYFGGDVYLKAKKG